MKTLIDGIFFISPFSKLKSINNSNYSKLSFLLLILFSGCDEASNLVNSDSTSDGRSIHGIVTDSNDNSRLDSVKVYWTDTNGLEFTYTDTVGYYRIDGLTQSTTYDITFEKDNYATMIRKINILDGGMDDDIFELVALVDGENFTSFVEESTSGAILSAQMYPLIGSVSGKVYKVLDDENTQLASGVVILAHCQESNSNIDDNNYSSSDNDNVISISPNQFVDTTGTDGIYNFNNLPLTSSLVLTALPYNDNTYSFAAQTQTVTLSPNITITVDDIKLPVATQTPFLISNNFENDDFQLNENITLTFSATMKTDNFEISLNNGSDEIPFTATWSNNISLTINPSLTLQAKTTYSLSLNGNSTSNGTFDQELTFITQDGIELLSTNTERADGVFDQFNVSSDILLEFSMTPDLNNAGNTIDLKDASSSKVFADVSLSGTTVTINPAYDLEYGQNYTFTYKIYSSIAGDYDDGIISFSTSTVQTSSPEQVTEFKLTTYVGNIDYNTTIFDFQWNNSTNANGYRIYVNDNNLNSDFIDVGSFEANAHLTINYQTIDLAFFPQFDLYPSDGEQTPLSNNTELTFGVLAYNEIGESPISELITIKDNNPPTIIIQYDNVSSSFNNSSQYQVSRYFTITSNEHIHSDFNIGFLEASFLDSYVFGDSTYVLDSSAHALSTWSNDLKSVTIKISIPGEKDASGDYLTISNLKDNSMNTANIPNYRLCGYGDCQILGCTNPTASNYNPDATIEDGSCIIYGCTNPTASNYNPDATIEDGSCIIYGCTDIAADNYNADATIDDGSCIIYGCIDIAADNYNVNATVNDGSCQYTENTNIISYNFNDNNIPSSFITGSGNLSWYITTDSYEGGYAIRSSNPYNQYPYFEFTTTGIPIGKVVTVSFYAKGVTDGDGDLYVNNYNTGSNYGADYSNYSYKLYYYIFVSSSSTNTFKWNYDTDSYGYGMIDNIKVTWQ